MKKRLRVIISVLIPTVVIISAVVTIVVLRNIHSEPEQEIIEIVEKKEEKAAETAGSADSEAAADSAEEAAAGSGYAAGVNYTLDWGPLMLINPNFTVSEDWIARRSRQLVDLAATYGIVEANAWNGTPRLDPEAAPHFYDMVHDYALAFPGHSLSTMSCFRAVGTTCGRLCYATGTSDHHSGYTCDLIDTAYGAELDTDYLGSHPEWTWLHENSYKYGFIDRFVENWAGGPMTEPVNVDANGSTGLYEVWHFRYVGIGAATEIATGRFNDGVYDSLEHYLKMTGRIGDLLNR